MSNYFDYNVLLYANKVEKAHGQKTLSQQLAV